MADGRLVKSLHKFVHLTNYTKLLQEQVHCLILVEYGRADKLAEGVSKMYIWELGQGAQLQSLRLGTLLLSYRARKNGKSPSTSAL